MWKPIILDVECIVCNKSLQKINHDPRHATRKMGKINNNRRLRTPNWSLEEKQYLLELIKQRKEVVVTKANNGPNYYEEKDIAWNEILRELAVKFGSKFTSSSIKKVKTQWQNMKRIAREEVTLNGPALQMYSKLTLEVCNILELVKDGVFKGENEYMNDTSIATNVEIKTERIEEDYRETNQPQPSCSGSTSMDIDNNQQNATNLNNSESSASSMSDVQISDINEFEPAPEVNNIKTKNSNEKINASASEMPEAPNVEEVSNIINPFHRDLQEYLKYTNAEKQLKMESLKEERQVIRAMRETAELNKIIAEQKLKHVLWAKNREMTMYAGEPGSGAGKGGGGGGSIREAGGTFGKMEAAREDEYFYKKQKEQLANLKGHLDKEISFHQEQIKRHEDAIRRHKEKMADMDNKQ